MTYQLETNLTWQPLYGERSSVRDHYRAGTLCLSKKDNSGSVSYTHLNIQEGRLFYVKVRFNGKYDKQPGSGIDGDVYKRQPGP